MTKANKNVLDFFSQGKKSFIIFFFFAEKAFRIFFPWRRALKNFFSWRRALEFALLIHQVSQSMRNSPDMSGEFEKCPAKGFGLAGQNVWQG